MTHEIIVGNVGCVERTNSYVKAHATFFQCVAASKSGYGRMAGESVIWMREMVFFKEFMGANDEHDETVAE